MKDKHRCEKPFPFMSTMFCAAEKNYTEHLDFSTRLWL